MAPSSAYWCQDLFIDPPYDYFDFFNGTLSATGNYDLAAMAIHDGDIAGIPEPTTMLFLGLGLMGVLGIRRKIQK